MIPRRHLLGFGLALAASGAIVTWRGLQRQPADDPASGGRVSSVTVVDDPAPVPEFSAASPRGPVTRATLQGHWSLLFFGYTQCPDVCPTALTLMTGLYQRLPAEARPQVLFISVDPERDTMALLAEFMPAFDASFLGAAGQPADIEALTRHLGVRWERHPGPTPTSYTVDHTASMFLIDPQARLKAVFSPPHTLDALLADYQRLRG